MPKELICFLLIMDLLNEMIEAKELPVVGYAEFLRSCQLDSVILYCFIEAKDDEIYYSNVLQGILGDTFETFKCRNKDGVLKVYHLVKGNVIYGEIRVAFFVDRDFDPLLNNPHVFETPWHSVENYYVDASCIKKLIHEQFGIDRINDAGDFALTLNRYLLLQNEFHKRVTNLNSWLSCHADERAKGNTLRINIDDKVKWKDIVNSNLDGVEIKALTFEELTQLFEVSEIQIDAFNSKVEVFRAVNAAHAFRGKFELKFLVSFLKVFSNEVSKPSGHLCSKRYSCTLQFAIENIVTTLSSYAVVPESLRNYIKEIAIR
jgi:hypothetical protein